MSENKIPEIIWIQQLSTFKHIITSEDDLQIAKFTSDETTIGPPYILKSKYDELSKRFSAMETNNTHLKAAAKKRNTEIAELKKEIERLKKGKWVSVEDRLPEYGEKVLTFRKKSENSYEYIDIASYGSVGKGFASAITHWMPLPESPEK